MTKTNSIASKLFVGFVATAMLFTLSYTPAKAQTAEELQAQIAALMAQISALQGGSSSSSSSCYTFTMDLTMGSTGAEVTALQNFLMGKGHAIAAGATGYFGGQTQAALSAFQSANGIAPAAGYFGPITRAAVNGMCTPVVVDDSTDDSDDSSDDSDDSSSEELSGEASLDDVTANDGDATDIEEGQEDQPVAEFDVEFADGDARITRIDIGLVAVTSNEEDPWDTFEEVSLWVDGEEVAREDASDEDEYLDEDDGTIRFSGLDIVAMEDEEVTITVGVSTQGSIDDVPATWRVDMEAMRFMDADDVATTETSVGDMGTGNGTEFEIDVEGADDEIIVKTNSDDPDADTLVVEEDAKSDWMTIFMYDLDTDDSTNDIEVTSQVIGIATSDKTDDMISDIRLVVDGQNHDDWTIGAADQATTTYTFDIDSNDFVIEAGERVTVEVQVEFLKQSGNYAEGTTIFATTTGSTGEYEGADDVTGEGSATGETHVLRTEGITVSAETDDHSTDTQGENDTTGIFEIVFDVTALQGDFYIAEFASTTSVTNASTGGVGYTIDGPATPTSSNGVLSSTAEEDTNGVFTVREDETETFTLTVTVDASATGQHRVNLGEIYFSSNSDGTTNAQLETPLPESDFRTGYVNINAS